MSPARRCKRIIPDFMLWDLIVRSAVRHFFLVCVRTYVNNAYDKVYGTGRVLDDARVSCGFFVCVGSFFFGFKTFLVNVITFRLNKSLFDSLDSYIHV